MRYILVLLFLTGNLYCFQDFLFKCTGDAEKILPHDSIQKNSVWNEKERAVNLQGAKNEFVAFQVILNGGKSGITGVKLSAGDFKGESGSIDKSNIEFFNEHYMKVNISSRGSASEMVQDSRAGEFPVQMIPEDAKKFNFPVNADKDRNQPVWVDIYIPGETKAGDYEAEFVITLSGGKEERFKVKMKVWNFSLPEESHFNTYAYFGREQIQWAFNLKEDGKEVKELAWRFLKMARQHRVNMCPNLEIYDTNFDFDEYWSRYGAYIDGSACTEKAGKGAPVSMWMMGVSLDNHNQYVSMVKKAYEFFKEKKLENVLINFTVDEPGSKEAYDNVRRMGKWSHEAVPGKLLPVMVTEQIRPSSSFGTLEGFVDIFNSGGINPGELNSAYQRGLKVWTYNMGWGGGPYVDTPGLAGRTQGWVGYKYNLNGWEFWDCTYWVDKHNLRKTGLTSKTIDANPLKYATGAYTNPLTFDETRKGNYPERDAIKINGDGVLFYPGYDIGIDGPVASFTLKSLRRGFQDYEYMYLLKKAGKEKIVSPIIDSVIFDKNSYSKDSERWYSARIKLGEMLDALSNPVPEKTEVTGTRKMK